MQKHYHSLLLSLLSLPLLLAPLACSEEEGPLPSEDAGGASNTGGTSSSGGSSSSGGTTATGGMSNPGEPPAGTGGSPTEEESCAQGMLCGSSCINLNQDRQHCGSCDVACEVGQDCVEGACITTSSSACPTDLRGWATVSDLGITSTTGGGNAPPVRPQSVEELINYAKDTQPRVIEIQGTFRVPELFLSSNKTLIGIGADATIEGGLRIHGKSVNERTSNVIVRNLRIHARHSTGAQDGIEISYAHHIWVDHCEILDAPDGNLDVVRASDYVTVSWTKFRYTDNPPDNNHRFSNLVGNGDNREAEDGGRLRVSYHNNWWAERVHERMPRVRFGQVHVFNNHFSSQGNNYCVRAGRGARLLIENNYFENVRSPHEFNNSTDKATAHITSRNNFLVGTSGSQETGGGGSPFSAAPYSVQLSSAEQVKDQVRACAGPQTSLL